MSEIPQEMPEWFAGFQDKQTELKKQLDDEKTARIASEADLKKQLDDLKKQLDDEKTARIASEEMYEMFISDMEGKISDMTDDYEWNFADLKAEMKGLLEQYEEEISNLVSQMDAFEEQSLQSDIAKDKLEDQLFELKITLETEIVDLKKRLTNMEMSHERDDMLFRFGKVEDRLAKWEFECTKRCTTDVYRDVVAGKVSKRYPNPRGRKDKLQKLTLAKLNRRVDIGPACGPNKRTVPIMKEILTNARKPQDKMMHMPIKNHRIAALAEVDRNVRTSVEEGRAAANRQMDLFAVGLYQECGNILNELRREAMLDMMAMPFLDFSDEEDNNDSDSEEENGEDDPAPAAEPAPAHPAPLGGIDRFA